jgi:hypothetical protein
MSVNVLYQTSTRATAGRDGHGCRIYPQQMRGSSLELRGDSRNVRNCCICVVALSRKTESGRPSTLLSSKYETLF